MVLHPSVKQSFFIRFLLYTVCVGNVYIGLQALAHTFNFHLLDLYLRWYAFIVPPMYHLLLLLGAGFTLFGAVQIFKLGMNGFRLYMIGKLITLLAFVVLTMLQYQASKLPYPFVLIPIIMGVQLIYPMFLYLSLRKSTAIRKY